MSTQFIWNYLKSRGLSDSGVAGLMGNLYAESGLNPKNLQNSFEKKLGFTDESYTERVDNVDYSVVDFIHDCAGYGLAQWTYWKRKQKLAEFAQKVGKSIGDLQMQLDFLIEELQTDFPAVLKVLKQDCTVLEASNAVLLNFEKPADQSKAVQSKRASYGQKYYNQFHSEGVIKLTEQQLRNKVVTIAKKYLGCKESDGSHRKIIDLYNSHKPLARSYKVTYTDAWCATFVSAVAIEAGLTDIMPTECGCSAMIKLYQARGLWVEDDGYVPSIGDVVMYDWQDNGVGDNKGAADHVGIVISCDGHSFTVIEGNKNNAVETRRMAVNGKYIRGYCLPNYASVTSQGAVDTGSGSTVNNTKEDTKVDLAQFKELWGQMRRELQDNDAENWSQEARDWSVRIGLIHGNGETVNGEPNYMWEDLLTREQMVTVLYRFAQLMGKA